MNGHCSLIQGYTFSKYKINCKYDEADNIMESLAASLKLGNTSQRGATFSIAPETFDLEAAQATDQEKKFWEV